MERAFMSAARQALQASGREAHQRLHEHPVFTPLLRADLTRAQYLTALKALHGFHAPLERQAAALGLPGGRLPALAADLAVLGVTEMPPECRRLPPLNTRAEALAIRWLLDGSSRGGQVMAPNIARALNLDEQRGISFFSVNLRQYCDKSFENQWSVLCGVIETELAAAEPRAAACRAATMLFDALLDWLNEAAHDSKRA
jgi:heme oxygenase (biliverdin-IX-beta and delta-forming)